MRFTGIYEFLLSERNLWFNFYMQRYFDASNVACGAYLVGTEEVSHRMWSSSEAEKSSTWRELKAVHFALTPFKNFVQRKFCQWYLTALFSAR